MSERTQITISLSESKGPIAPRMEHVSDETGSTSYRTSGFATKCPECEQTPIAGETITKILGAWFHADCGAKALNRMHADRAWLALGQQLERAPSRFTNAETKAIVRNLLKIAGAYIRLADETDDGEPEWEHDEQPTLQVIEGGRFDGPDPWASAVIDEIP